MVLNMKNYRIIEIYGKSTINEIKDFLSTKPFTEKSGFIINKKRDDTLEAVHIYKKEITKKIVSLNGDEETVSYFDHVRTNFKFIIIAEKKYVIIVNPPRDSKTFHHDLKMVLPKFIALKNLRPNPMDFYSSAIKKSMEVNINELDVSDININNRGIARFVFSSEKDIYHDAMSFIGNKNYTVRSISMTIEHNNTNLKCKININGSISMSEYDQIVMDTYVSS